MITFLGELTESLWSLSDECQDWFNANEMVTPAPQEYSSEELQVISLDNICMWMVHGLPQHISVVVDGFERIVLERFSSWERET